MNITLKHVRSFIEVARASSFTHASEILGLSQPALTMSIRQLEDGLDTPLFERTTRRVRLTPEGISFLPTAERLLNEFDSAISHIREEAKNTRSRISLAILPSVASLILPRVLRQFVDAEPDVTVHLRDMNSSEVQRRVRAGEVDIGIGSSWTNEPELEFEPLLTDRFVLVCRQDHPFAAETAPIKWSKVREWPFLALAMDTGIRPVLNEHPRPPVELENPRFEFSNVLTLGAVLEEGLGITVLPYLAAAGLRSQTLVFKELDGEALKRTINLVRRRNATLSSATLRFRTVLLETIAAFVSEHSDHVEFHEQVSQVRLKKSNGGS